jgi:type III secretory pathway lipoprotein EscJ
MSRGVIHLGVHNHHVIDGKCQESVEEIKRLITKEVDHTPYAKISSISFNVSKTFFASYLLDDFSDCIVEFFKGE